MSDPLVSSVIRPGAGQSHAALARRVRESVLPRMDARELWVTERAPPRSPVIPLSRAPMAVVVATAPAPAVDGLQVHAYRVRPSAPIEGAPGGPAMVTLFSRRGGLDRDDFLRRWHDGHTPLALRVHPLVRYVRHVVEAPIDGAPPLDGIVLEQVRDRADVVRPWRFFGGPLAMVPNMLRVGLDARGFIDLSTIENQLVSVESVG